MFLTLLPLLTNIAAGLITQYNLLGGDDKDRTIESSAETINSVIRALEKMRDGEPIDLAELKLDETYEQVLARIQQSSEQVDP